MRSICICALLCGAVLTSSPALAQHDKDHSARAVDEKGAVNAMCPIGKEEIVPSAGAVEYKGNTIGLCCPGCGKEFLAWDEARKDEFVAAAVAAGPGGAHADHAVMKPAVPSAPYTLSTCPVSGETLGSMGDAIVKAYGGREVRFCCTRCIGKFEADQEGYWNAIDEKIIADQLPYYPAQTCVVSGEPLMDDGEDISRNIVYANRLVRFCCKMCQKKFNANPAKYLAELDKAAADAQRPHYPIETCAVAGGQLGSMGDPTEMVIGGRLLRFCCASCEPKVSANPIKYITMIDAAWHAKGMFAGQAGAPADAEHEKEDHGG